MTTITTNVQNCARCGGTHASLTFTALTAPTDEYGHWAMCPTLQQPILLKVVATA